MATKTKTAVSTKLATSLETSSESSTLFHAAKNWSLPIGPAGGSIVLKPSTGMLKYNTAPVCVAVGGRSRKRWSAGGDSHIDARFSASRTRAHDCGQQPMDGERQKAWTSLVGGGINDKTTVESVETRRDHHGGNNSQTRRVPQPFRDTARDTRYHKSQTDRRTCMFFSAVCTGAPTRLPGGASIAGVRLMGREYDAEAPESVWLVTIINVSETPCSLENSFGVCRHVDAFFHHRGKGYICK